MLRRDVRAGWRGTATSLSLLGALAGGHRVPHARRRPVPAAVEVLLDRRTQARPHAPSSDWP